LSSKAGRYLSCTAKPDQRPIARKCNLRGTLWRLSLRKFVYSQSEGSK